MKLQDFAMLQPCGTDVFNGVEFVCCPLDSEIPQPGIYSEMPLKWNIHIVEFPFLNRKKELNALKVEHPYSRIPFLK